MNDSSTGGPLTPEGTSAPLMGQLFNRFLQQWVVGLTGLDGALVRPRYQAEPPDIPQAATAWAAVGVARRATPGFPSVVHDGDNGGSDNFNRQEDFTLACSFYDLGVNGLADTYASLLRDGVMIAQNREVIEAAGVRVRYTDEMLPVPMLVKLRWLYRVDLNIMMSRMITRTYPVRNINRVTGTITTDTGYTKPFDTGVVST